VTQLVQGSQTALYSTLSGIACTLYVLAIEAHWRRLLGQSIPRADARTVTERFIGALDDFTRLMQRLRAQLSTSVALLSALLKRCGEIEAQAVKACQEIVARIETTWREAREAAARDAGRIVEAIQEVGAAVKNMPGATATALEPVIKALGTHAETEHARDREALAKVADAQAKAADAQAQNAAALNDATAGVKALVERLAAAQAEERQHRTAVQQELRELRQLVAKQTELLEKQTAESDLRNSALLASAQAAVAVMAAHAPAAGHNGAARRTQWSGRQALCQGRMTEPDTE
jgi:chromosome segregation ATPase